MFSKKTVVITGASSGLGEALALEFARNGANLALFDRDENELLETEKLCHDSDTAPLLVVGDVTKHGDCENLIARTIERFNRLDYLVACAGVSMWAKFEEIEDISIFRKLMEVNYLGVVHCTYYALPYLKKNRGMVVAISSIQGKIGVSFHTGYVASKFALQGFFESLRMELHESGIDILMVLPHWLRGTNLRKNAFGKNGKVIGGSRDKHTKESIALEKCCQAIIKAIRKRKRELVIPSKLKLLPWLNLINPRIVEFIVTRKVKHETKQQEL